MPSNETAATTLMREAFDAFNAHDVDRCIALLRDDFIINIMPHQARGHQAWRDNIETMLAAFPDLHAEILDIFGTEDKVALRLRFTGTHTGSFYGIAASGKRVDYTSLELYRVANGKIAEEWIASDTASLFEQLGATPPAA